MILDKEFFTDNEIQIEILSKLIKINLNIKEHLGLDVPLLTDWRNKIYSSNPGDHILTYDGYTFQSVGNKKHIDARVREYIENRREDGVRELLGESPRKDLHDKKVWYKCGNCGNKALSKNKPNEEICGGCDDPDWKLMKHQMSYTIGASSYIHPDGEI